MRLYPLGRFVCTPVLRTYFRERIEGREHVPKTGPFVLTANHVSYIDPVVLGVACPRPVHFMAKAELFQIPVLGFLISQLELPCAAGAADGRHSAGIAYTKRRGRRRCLSREPATVKVRR